jgi:hypothetical protein
VDHEAIRKNGWRQGHLFTAEDTRALAESVGCSVVEGGLFVLVSHDCDIVHSGDSEPYAYVCVAEPLTEDQLDGGKSHGKNSRSLQVPVQSGSESCVYEVQASSLIPINREQLQKLVPHESCTLSATSTDVLARWLASRFERAAFPDTFNERLRPVSKKVIEKFKKYGEPLTAIYLTVEPDTELTEQQNYKVSLIGVLPSEEHEKDALRISVSGTIGEVAKLLNDCKGIEVLNYEVLPESGVTLQDLRYLARWDLDYLSFRGGSDPPPR